MESFRVALSQDDAVRILDVANDALREAQVPVPLWAMDQHGHLIAEPPEEVVSSIDGVTPAEMEEVLGGYAEALHMALLSGNIRIMGVTPEEIMGESGC